MSEFTCEVMKIDEVYKHPEADRLSIVKVRGYNCISNLNEDGTPRYKAGDLAVYIPEGAVMPEWLLQKMDFWKDGKGMLAGSKGNRVKAIKLRGIVSQGILYPVAQRDCNVGFIHAANGDAVQVGTGDNCAEDLGIIKYEPVIPASMAGEVFNIGRENTLNFDIENIQKYPNIFADGEEVVFTEKLHGTFCAFAYGSNLNEADAVEGKFFAFSKGLGAQGLVFKNNEKNANNVYQRALLQYMPQMKSLISQDRGGPGDYTIFVLGELYGAGIQDLVYDGAGEVKFRFFSAVVKGAGVSVFLNEDELKTISEYFERVPVLYRGPFSMAKVNEFKDGNTTLGTNIREGLVITPVVERRCDEFGRVALKAISAAYLLRKGNTTEYN